MPPETKPIPVPVTDGKDSKEWLEAHGLVARQPAIRSSDYESVLHCPFQYYLSRRLGLVQALRWSAALSRGSWFHKRLEYYNLSPLEANRVMEEEYEKRESELTDICQVRGIKGESKQRMIEREYQDMLCASAWFDVAMHLPIPGKGPFLGEKGYINRRYWRVLGTEVVAEYKHPEFGRMLAQFDMLLYHEDQNTVYILDLKTTAHTTISRLQTCPIEFQTQHYMHILKWMLEEQSLTKPFDIPRDAKVGGMIHLAVQKPTIEFGMNDRNCEEHEHELSRGPRKGQIEIRRKYFGEPRIENYIERCRRWYQAEGEYEEKKPERESDPAVNFSLTGGSTLDTRYTTDYTNRLRLVHSYATIDPVPHNFPKSASYLMQFGKMSPFSPFYLTPTQEWPGIVSTEGFMVEDRDDVEVGISVVGT
jgi:hypothetical protein